MDDFAFVNKSYIKDLEWSFVLYQSFEAFVWPKREFYLIVPDADISHFAKRFEVAKDSGEIDKQPNILAESAIITCAGISEEDICQMYAGLGGWGVQQVIKLAFYHSGFAENYLTIDSAAVFTREVDFRDEFFDGLGRLRTQASPVSRAFRARFLNENGQHGFLDGAPACLSDSFDAISTVLGNLSDETHWYTSGTGIFSAKALASLEGFLKSKGFKDFVAAICFAPYELTWYGEYLFMYQPIDFVPVGPELMHHNETIEKLTICLEGEVILPKQERRIGFLFQPPISEGRIQDVIKKIESYHLAN